MNLISGMVLVTKTYGDLHYLITTPYGYRIIDACGNCEELELDNYEKAYIPQSYDNLDMWKPLEGTEIFFNNEIAATLDDNKPDFLYQFVKFKRKRKGSWQDGFRVILLNEGVEVSLGEMFFTENWERVYEVYKYEITA